MSRRSIARLLLIGLLTALFTAPVGATSTAQPTSASAPQAASAFTDLPTSHWAYPAVAKLMAVGGVSPSPDGTFNGSNPVTRAELAKMLLGARRIPVVCNGLFADAPCSNWEGAYMETAYRLGIYDMVGDAISPDGPVTREELMSYGVRAAGQRFGAGGLPGALVAQALTFSDQGSITQGRRSDVALAVRLGLLSGYGDGSLRPQALASRAEAAVLASRLIQDRRQLTAAGIQQLPVAAQFQMKATAYAPGEEDVGLWTASGMKVRTGVIAVDPTRIPLGSWLYVEGWGYGIAADTGGAIKGNKIDLFTWDYDEAARRFGVQARTVWLLG